MNNMFEYKVIVRLSNQIQIPLLYECSQKDFEIMHRYYRIV